MARSSSHGNPHLFQAVFQHRRPALRFLETCRSANAVRFLFLEIVDQQIHSLACFILGNCYQQIHSLARFSLLERCVRYMVLHDTE
jgi:hypothetical protein